MKIEPWERRPDESASAFAAFATYRDLGVKRSLTEVARRSAKSRPLMKRWSARHSWVERVEAWDREQDRLWRIEQAEARRTVAQKHLRVGALMLSKASQRLVNIDVEKLTPTELERWIRTGAELERSAIGEDSADAAQAAAGLITELARSLRR